MDVLNAVKEKENYAGIAEWFGSQGDLTPEQMVLLADTIDGMSEEIFEHYKGLCDLLKAQLQRVRRICGEEGCGKAYPEAADRSRLSYALERACAQRAVLAEKYEGLAGELEK